MGRLTERIAGVHPAWREPLFDSPQPPLPYPPGSAQLGRVEVWRGGCRSTYPVAAPFVWRCRTVRPWLRLHTPLIEPDMQISRIWLSDKLHAFTHATSCPSGRFASAE